MTEKWEELNSELVLKKKKKNPKINSLLLFWTQLQINGKLHGCEENQNFG